MKRYNPKDIESKWQHKWDEQGIYCATEDTSKPKRYVLEYFPYPSGAAMHVGHVRNYTIGDALARYYRMSGYNVMHPMGWDAFGLPAENYAIKNNISPKQAIAENTTKFKQQLTQMGFSYDWSREINSSDPNYYKWTQWFFTLLFERGLAYQKDSLQWWCDTDKTVLANEQVEAGRCWRCGNTVTKKPLKQWFFKITDYADRLVEDLDDLDWSESIKSMQRNWIGKSKGAEISFVVKGRTDTITVFTTRPDTLFGATFMVLAPEHPLVQKITSPDQKSAVDSYIAQTQAKSDVERQETDREKTGVFTGAYAVNPVNSQQIPIWIADYVLYGYGTGAIMAVPAHDDRDQEFARKFNLPIVHVVAPTMGEAHPEEIKKRAVIAIVRNPHTDQVIVLDWGPRQTNYGGNMLIGGTVHDNEDTETTARREITEETGYKDLELVAKSDVPGFGHFFSNVKMHHVYVETEGILFDLKSDEKGDTTLDEGEKDKFKLKWQPIDKVSDMLDDEVHRYYFDTLVSGTSFHDEGQTINSGPYDGLTTAETREKIVADLAAQGTAKEVVNYRIRDWLISRQRYWGAPIPIIHCPADGPVPVPEDQLPVVLPEVKSYQPTGEGTSVLASVADWVNTECPKCGGPATRETDTMDGFACSSWYFLRFADPRNETAPFDPAKAKFWLPVDDYIGGAEHAVMHLLYARMWTKVMHDAGMIDFDEPFKALRNQGMILAPDGRKMSKSFGNVIAPDELIDQGYGADAIRIMELFIGPWDQAANWSVEGMGGCYRFLNRIWALTHEYLAHEQSSADSNAAEDSELLKITHKAIYRVSKDMQEMGFNTAIATMMETVNSLYKVKTERGFVAASSWRIALTTLIQLLAPFAPHITEELWEQLGNAGSVHISIWPVHDESYLIEQTVTIAVQVNGKLRGQITIPADATQADAEAAARAQKQIADHLTGDPKKVIYIPARILNFVI